MRTIYLVSTVPQGGTVFRKSIDKMIKILGLPPLHRYGIDALIPWQKPLRSPHASSRSLLRHMKKLGKVRYYSLYEKGVIRLKPEDFFIGQPMPKDGFSMDGRPDTDEHWSITSRTLRENPDNHHKFLIVPFANNDLLMSWLHDLAKNYADGIVLIGATQWMKEWEKGPFGDIPREKVLPIDNAVDPSEYPFIKTTFNPPEKRKFLYLGHTGWYKNSNQLEEIARKMPGFEGAHIGGGKLQGWKSFGYASFTSEFLAMIAREYDIFLTTSTADAQATTIMENMCYGFPIACTPETGYVYPSVVALDTSNTEKNIRTLTEMKNLPEAKLRKMVAQNLGLIQSNHLWEKYVTRTSDFMGLK